MGAIGRSLVGVAAGLLCVACASGGKGPSESSALVLVDRATCSTLSECEATDEIARSELKALDVSGLVYDRRLDVLSIAFSTRSGLIWSAGLDLPQAAFMLEVDGTTVALAEPFAGSVWFAEVDSDVAQALADELDVELMVE